MNYYAAYLNLLHRVDRKLHMEKELHRVGIKADRIDGKYPIEFDQNDPRLKVMRDRTPGAIPCHFGQVDIMEKALDFGKNAFVMEDDLIFCSDFDKRMAIIDEFLEGIEWDIFWLGGTFHKNPTWHKLDYSRLPLEDKVPHKHENMKGICHCTLNRDWQPTFHERIVRTYGIWSTYAYIVNVNSIEKILTFLDKNLHLSIGIDWLMILGQPEWRTYCFLPGMVKQYDNESNIGNGITKFSGFAGLGGYWWQDRMEQFNPKKLRQ